MKFPKLIAFTGRAGSGKDTASAALKDLYHNHNFADALKYACMAKFGLSWEDVFTQEGKMRYNDVWGRTNREILQQEGTEASKPFWGEDIWIKTWELKYDPMKATVVTDCRFVPEAKKIKELGGIIIGVFRPDQEDTAGDHISEQGLPQEYIDYSVLNIGTIEELHTHVINTIDWHIANVGDEIDG